MEILPESYFEDTVRNEVRRAVRYSYPFAVVSVHLATPDLTESVMLPVARVLGSVIRDSDVVGRLKGPRLGVILPYADAGAARSISDRIRETLISDADLAPWGPGLRRATLRATVFPSTTGDADAIFRWLGSPENSEGEDDDEGPGPAPVGARI